MKFRYLIFLSVAVFSLTRCTHEKKIAYNIPANYPESKKPELLALLEKGRKLYKANCSQCHGIFTKGEDGVPNFTDIQIDNYSAGFMRRSSKNHAVALQMSPEQLNEILNFLRYHKTSGAQPTQKRDRKVVPPMPGRS